MLSFDAIQYAMKFARSHESDQMYIDNNTFEGLLTAFQEEMGECIAAIGKYKRALGDGPVTPVPKDEALNSIIEETADVLATGILLADKMKWIEECLNRHAEKSTLCMNRILDKEKHDGEAE